jgi:AGZA family xanthine/uracil permease-like MFS transporter
VTTGVLFLLSLFIAPVIGVIPVAATAPALILVGCMMMSTVREVDWDDFSTAAPAFLTIVMIPLTYSIANGLAIGVIAYDLLKVLRGRGGEQHWLLHLLAALFLARFVYLGAG